MSYRRDTRRPTDNWANRGMGFEGQLNDLHQYYKALARGWAVKQHLPMVIVNHDARGNLAKVTGRATVDYIACVGGRFVAFDAKDCAEARIELTRLEPHQLQDMIDIVRCGGQAFVLARFERKRCYLIPALAWAAAVAASKGGKPETIDGWTPSGRASIREKDLPSAWAIDDVDWIGGILRHGTDDHG